MLLFWCAWHLLTLVILLVHEGQSLQVSIYKVFKLFMSHFLLSGQGTRISQNQSSQYLWEFAGIAYGPRQRWTHTQRVLCVTSGGIGPWRQVRRRYNFYSIWKRLSVHVPPAFPKVYSPFAQKSFFCYGLRHLHKSIMWRHVMSWRHSLTFPNIIGHVTHRHLSRVLNYYAMKFYLVTLTFDLRPWPTIPA